MRRFFFFIVLASLAAIATSGIGPRAEAAVYWGGGSSVGAANLDGSVPIIGYPHSIANAFAIGNVCGVSVDAGHVYWADQSHGAIGRLAQPAGTIRGPVDIVHESVAVDEALISGLISPCGVAVNGTHIYWADRSGLAIGRANLDGGAVERNFIAGAAGPCGIAVDGTYVYWANQSGDSIGRARLDGSNADHSFISGADEPCGVAVGGGHLYWASQSGGSIGRADLGGGNVKQDFVAGLESPCGVAVDSGHLYWANSWGRDPVGRANLDGSGVTRSLVSTDSYHASCGVALDSRSFLQMQPSASPPIFLGRAKRDKRKGFAYLTVKAPAVGGGVLRVETRRLAWRFLSAPVREGGYLLWQLKVRPANGKPGRRIRRRLKRKGLARTMLQVIYEEAGKTAFRASRQLTLIRRPRHRPAT